MSGGRPSGSPARRVPAASARGPQDPTARPACREQGPGGAQGATIARAQDQGLDV